MFNLPGVTAAGNNLLLSSAFGSTAVDSVDADNGAIDGNGQRVGNMGEAYWANGSPGFTFTFVGPLPTHAGVVWTDGAGLVSFLTWDSANALIAHRAGILKGEDQGYTGRIDRGLGSDVDGQVAVSALAADTGGKGIGIIDATVDGTGNTLNSPEGIAVDGSVSCFAELLYLVLMETM